MAPVVSFKRTLYPAKLHNLYEDVSYQNPQDLNASWHLWDMLDQLVSSTELVMNILEPDAWGNLEFMPDWAHEG